MKQRRIGEKTCPQIPVEWQIAIRDGIGLSEIEGQKAYQMGVFPYQQLEQWIQEEYREGFVPDFVPTLLRNIKGLVTWVYGNGIEPNWRGSDVEILTSIDDKRKAAQPLMKRIWLSPGGYAV
jgi:hypothetical protein